MYNKYLIQENTRVLNNEETIYFPEEYNAALTYDVGGHILWTDWHDNSVSDYVRKNGVWEYNMLGLWGHLFKRGQNVVVVGAHIGTHLVHIADLVGPEGQIYCFEPNPFTYEILQANWVLNNMTNVRLYNKALSNQNGNMSFVIDYPNSGGSFLLSGNYTPPSHLNKINVQIMKLDDMLKDVG
jgi:FkbM family methyltransferase